MATALLSVYLVTIEATPGGRAMYLVWIGTAMVVMKWLEVGPVERLSWWWVLAPLAVALVWFECLERLFGRDRRQVEAADFESRSNKRMAQAVKASGRR